MVQLYSNHSFNRINFPWEGEPYIMKSICRLFLPGLLFGSFCLFTPSLDALTSPMNESKVDDGLLAAFEEQGEDALLSINVVLQDQVDTQELLARVKGLSREVRRATAINELKSLSNRAQADLLDYLEEMERTGEVADISTLWLIDAVNAKATRAVVAELSQRDDVYWIGYNKTVYALVGVEKMGKKSGAIKDEDTLAGTGGGPYPAATDTSWGVLWINAPAAWQMGYRGKDAIVAIIDTGIWYYHSDLENRMWVNADEIPGDGIDNDNNGYIDDIYGYDFHNHDSDPLGSGGGHGTHVSGTVAGDGTGGTLTGVAPEAQLMACKVLDDWGYGDEWDAWEGIQYAVDNGAHVLQGSIGWIHLVHYPDRSAWRGLCDNVLAAGVIMSFAAGNERGWYSPPDDIRTPADCPPPWHHPDQTLTGGLSAVVAVGATGYYNDNYAYFSSNGPASWEYIDPYYDYPYNPEMGLLKPDVCAPGENINSTVVGGGYSGDTWSGTSMATPHNSGLIALMLSKNMALTPAEIDSILETTSLERGPSGKDNDYGSGRIQADAALNATPELAGVTITMVPADTVVTPGSNLLVTVTFENTRSTPLTFDFWIVTATPWGRIVQVLPPTSHTLAAFETQSNDLNFPIRSSVPLGNYRVVGLIGGYPSQVMDRDLFFLSIISGIPQ